MYLRTSCFYFRHSKQSLSVHIAFFLVTYISRFTYTFVLLHGNCMPMVIHSVHAKTIQRYNISPFIRHCQNGCHCHSITEWSKRDPISPIFLLKIFVKVLFRSHVSVLWYKAYHTLLNGVILLHTMYCIHSNKHPGHLTKSLRVGAYLFQYFLQESIPQTLLYTS